MIIRFPIEKTRRPKDENLNLYARIERIAAESRLVRDHQLDRYVSAEDNFDVRR